MTVELLRSNLLARVSRPVVLREPLPPAIDDLRRSWLPAAVDSSSLSDKTGLWLQLDIPEST